LEFVCLVGDANGSYIIPAYSQSGGVGDWNYTRLDGTDLLPDVAMGRLCYNSTGELDVILNKTFYYEREPAPAAGGTTNPNWYRGAGLCVGSGAYISGVYTMRWIRERLLENG
ncbi:MAG: C25 family cysteine peptidase, partial [bacterium]